ncbi:MAG TPA: hypothetical protein VFG35_28625, partial [Actinoplanes sp.]|nr:hypothetical protein [Actinoplanes sp.]
MTIRGHQAEVDGDAATAVLRDRGLNPANWSATGYRSSEWTMPNGDTGISARFTFTRTANGERPPIADLIAEIQQHKPAATRPDG